MHLKKSYLLLTAIVFPLYVVAFNSILVVDTPIIAEPQPATNRRVVHKTKNQSLFIILTPLL